MWFHCLQLRSEREANETSARCGTNEADEGASQAKVNGNARKGCTKDDGSSDSLSESNETAQKRLDAVKALLEGERTEFQELQDAELLPTDNNGAEYSDRQMKKLKHVLLKVAIAAGKDCGETGRKVLPSAGTAAKIAIELGKSQWKARMSEEHRAKFLTQFKNAIYNYGSRKLDVVEEEEGGGTAKQTRKANDIQAIIRRVPAPIQHQASNKGVDNVIKKELMDKVELDIHGMMTSIEAQEPNIDAYVEEFSVRAGSGKITVMEADFLAKQWPHVDAHLRTVPPSEILETNTLPLLHNPTLLDFHLCVLLNNSAEEGLRGPFAENLKLYTSCADELFLNRPQTVQAHQRSLRARHKGVTIPEEVVFFWLTNSHFGETLRTIRVAKKIPFGRETYKEVNKNVSPVTLMCLYGEDMTVDQFSVHCEGVLMWPTQDVYEALFVYTAVWFLFNMQTGDFAEDEGDSAIRSAKAMKRGRNKKGETSNKRTKKVLKLAPRVTNTIHFLARILLNVRNGKLTGVEHLQNKGEYMRLLRKFYHCEAENKRARRKLAKRGVWCE